MEELFKRIEDSYLISNQGRVFNIKRDTELKTWLDKQGYKVLILQFSGKPVNCRVHRLVADAFIPNPLNKPQVNHIDGNKLNNAYTNLEWVTSSENNQHAFDSGLRKSGENHHKAKLTESDVGRIRHLLEEGLSHRYIAGLFSVGRTTISKIAKGEIWKHY